ncbi:hypothetical protein HNY73_015611 [Argiope bruennichi]|uniref:Uncharacterized protein n=1 Tax=Argiope bruennichi TaxID=94029 RepID=A0A8T0ET66_ARGBR|nr:hypothetical protein HNY73_015611 [Argiope bruennichi]
MMTNELLLRRVTRGGNVIARPQEFSFSTSLSSSYNFWIILNDCDEPHNLAVKNYLMKNFKAFFSIVDSDVGRCKMAQHRIDYRGPSPPIKTTPQTSCPFQKGRNRETN